MTRRSLYDALKPGLDRLEAAEAFLRDLERSPLAAPDAFVLHDWHAALPGSVDKWRLDYHEPAAFEWLCYSIVAASRNHAGRGLMLGNRRQDGLDFYAWDLSRAEPFLVAFEAKKRKLSAKFTAGEMQQAVNRYLSNDPPAYCKRFVLMLSGDLALGADEAKQECQDRLRQDRGIELEVWTQREILQELARTPSVAAQVFDDERVFRELCGGYYRHLAEVARVLEETRRTQEQREVVAGAQAVGAVLRTDYPPSWRDHRVSLTLIPPTLRAAGSGSLLIHAPDHTGAVITLSHEAILNLLWPGHGGGLDRTHRRFVVGPMASDRSGRVFVRFPGVELQVASETLDSLLRAIDALVPLYLDGLRALEREAGAAGHGFLHDPHGGPQPVLCSVPLWLWHDILAFMRAHDFQKGTGPWFIFDAAPTFLRVYLPADRAGAGRGGYRVIIEARPVILEPYDQAPEEAEVVLTWTPPSPLNPLPLGSDGYWPCGQALEWLRGDLVPAVHRRYRRPRKRRSLLDILLGEPPRDDPVTDHREAFRVPLSDDPMPGELLDAIERLQTLFIAMPQPEPVPLSGALWRSLIERCLEIAALVPKDLHYPASKLGLSADAGADIAQFLHEGRALLNDGAGSTMPATAFDHVLRALMVFLRDGRPALSDSLRHRTAESLRPLIAVAEEVLLVGRHHDSVHDSS